MVIKWMGKVGKQRGVCVCARVCVCKRGREGKKWVFSISYLPVRPSTYPRPRDAHRPIVVLAEWTIASPAEVDSSMIQM